MLAAPIKTKVLIGNQFTKSNNPCLKITPNQSIKCSIDIDASFKPILTHSKNNHFFISKDNCIISAKREHPNVYMMYTR